jgi:hypothetical protein
MIAEKPLIFRSPRIAQEHMETMAQFMGKHVMAVLHANTIVAYSIGAPALDEVTWFCDVPRSFTLGGAGQITTLRAITYRHWRRDFLEKYGGGEIVIRRAASSASAVYHV